MMKCIPLIEPNVDENVIVQSLLKTPKRKELMMFHFDITSSVIMSLKLMLSLRQYSLIIRICLDSLHMVLIDCFI